MLQKIIFSPNVRQCNIALVLYMYKIVLNHFCLLFFFLVGQGSGQFNKAYFVLPVGLQE